MPGEEQISVYVDADIKKQVRVHAAMNDMNMSEWVFEAIKEKLDREEDEGNPTAGQPAD